MSKPEAPGAAAKPRPVRKKLLSTAEMRSKASYRAMEKILDGAIDSDAQLWSVARVMSGDEYLAAAEERWLGGACGNALCRHAPQPAATSGSSFKIDSKEQKVYAAAAEGAGFCGDDCAVAARAFAHRLGSGAQAMHRFERLMDQWRLKKAAAAAKERADKADKAAADAGEAPAVPAAAAPVDPSKPKSALKKKVELAAGTSKVPIMAAEVKEREPAGAPAAPKVPSARRAAAVEGYVPRAALKHHKEQKKNESSEGDAKEKRRVRFSDAAEAEKADALPAPTCEISPVGYGWQQGDEAPMPAASDPSTSTASAAVDSSQRAVFVLDVEDPSGPLEGTGHDLASQFGTLRVAGTDDFQRAGLPVPPEGLPVAAAATAGARVAIVSSTDAEDAADGGDQDNGDATNEEECVQPVAAPEKAGAALPTAVAPGGRSVEDILTERLRQGAAKYFPQLASTLPPEMLSQLEGDTASEAGSSEASDASDWMLSDDEDLDALEDAILRHKSTFFGDLYSCLDRWATDTTLVLLRTGPGVAPPAGEAPGVPEIREALARFLSFALPPVATRLALDVPRSEVERALGELLRTLSLMDALPAFSTTQWQLALVVLLKALSMERLPALRPAFESRVGVARWNAELTAAGFTVEEFAAVLELLLDENA